MYCRKFESAFVAAILMLGCGLKEPPKPPPSLIPSPILDLSVQQRGMELILRMSYPTTTMGGLNLEEVQAVEIWEMKRFTGTYSEMEDGEVIEGADLEEGATPATTESAPDTEAQEEPATDQQDEEEGLLFALPEEVADATTPEEKLDVSPQEFGPLATLRWTLEGDGLDAAIVGDRLVLRMAIEALPEEEEVSIFGARVVSGPRRISPFSNLVKILPRQPPPPPTELAVSPQQGGIAVTWKESSAEKGYRVYRRPAKARDYGDSLASIPKDSTEHLDTTAVFDQRYIYTVTSVDLVAPLVESAIAAEHEVDYKDRFAPEPATEIIALAEQGRVRLLWQPSTSKDVAGYRIYRQIVGDRYEPLNDTLVVGSEYLDREVSGGQSYRYFVVAIDNAENASPASEEIEVRLP